MRRLKTFFILGALAITANWAQAPKMKNVFKRRMRNLQVNCFSNH